MSEVSKNSYIEPCNAHCSFCFLNYADVLSDNYLFRNLNPDEIGQIIKKIHHQVRNYDKNELIASSGDDYHSLYIIVEGAVVGEIIDFEGKVLRIEELRAPDTIASAFLFGDSHQLPVDVTAIEPTRLLSLPRQELLKVFKENERVLHNYLNIISNRAQHLSRKIKMLGLQTIRGKLAHYLLEQVKAQGGNEIQLKHTQADLAVMFGIARPSLARVIHDLNEAGIIRSSRRTINILDKSRLSSFLN